MQSKKDLILLHGAIGSKSQLDALADKLDDKYIIHQFDFPGHGEKANQSSQFSIHNFVNYLHNYIIKNEIYKPSVFGYSMGGYVALTLEAKAKVFNKIMTLNTKFHWDEKTAQKEKRMFIPEIIEEKVPHFADKLKEMHGKSNWTRLLKYHRNMMDDISENNALPDSLLRKIDTQVLITRSTNDEMVTKSESKRVVELIYNSDYYELENSRHAIEQSDINLLTEKIKEFFS